MKITKFAGIFLALMAFVVFSASVSAQVTGGDDSHGAVKNDSFSADTSSGGSDSTGAASAGTFGSDTTTGGSASTGAVGAGSFDANTSTAGSDSTGAVKNDSFGNVDTGGNNSTGAVSDPSNTGGSNPNNPGNDNGSNNRGSRNRSSGSVSVNTQAKITFVASTSCPLITDYLKLGGSNNKVQVSKLQAFLKNSEGLNVDVNGIFDQKTEDAVKAFQKKYLETIMGPWGATRASGFVYITTAKKINELACAKPMTLSASELAIIDSYKQNRTSSSVANANTNGSNTNATGTLEVGTLDENGNVAGAADASVLARFWSFIKALFR